MPLPEEGLIETIEYLTPEQSPRIPSMKNTIVDVKCTDQKGRIFIVEMQMQWTESFSKRLLFGASKAYVQQMQKAEDYHSLCPVYGLGIINDIFDRNSEDWFNHYRQVNVQKPERVLEGLELIFIELPKFKPQSWEQKRIGVLWLRFLKEFKGEQLEVPAEFRSVPEISKAVELTQESSYTPLELEAYDQYLDALRTVKTIEVDSFIAGKAEGRTEEKIEIAFNLLRQNLSLEVISSATGLSHNELKELKVKL
jgi:predicted transposase/invertase (TIGR01784 family)